MTDAYQIVWLDGGADLYTYGIPDEADFPHVVYGSLAAVQRALDTYTAAAAAAGSKKRPIQRVLYGEAFPYEATTFEQVLATKGVAPYGYVRVMDPEEEVEIRVCIAVLRVRLAN